MMIGRMAEESEASPVKRAARAMPRTTGFTCSRWLGLGASRTSSSTSSSATCDRPPTWYLTSPEPCSGRAVMMPRAACSSNSATIDS